MLNQEEKGTKSKSIQAVDIKEQMWLLIKRQGISFIIILSVAYFFYRENEKLRIDIKASNEEIKAYYKNDNAEMRRVLEKCNDVMERNNRLFEKFLNIKDK